MRLVICRALVLSAVVFAWPRTSLGQSGWYGQGVMNDTYFGVAVLDAQTAVAVGRVGEIMRSTDAGATWAPVYSGTTLDSYAVSFTDAYNGVAVGATGNIARTTDGGQSWFAQDGGTGNILVGFPS